VAATNPVVPADVAAPSVEAPVVIVFTVVIVDV